jgi:hypothetical protein
MARSTSPIASTRRASKATRDMLASRADAQRGYLMAPSGFTCVTCGHHEAAPRTSQFDATDEQEAARIAAVRTAVAQIKTHVAAHTA